MLEDLLFFLDFIERKRKCRDKCMLSYDIFEQLF